MDMKNTLRSGRLLGPFLVLGLGACAGGRNPVGTHQAASRVVVSYEPKPVGVPYDKDSPTTAVVTEESAGLYRVTFGSCWAKVSKPKQEADVWKVNDGSPCKSNLGTAKITSGSAQVFEDGKMNFSFQGIADDGKTTISWSFVGASKTS